MGLDSFKIIYQSIKHHFLFFFLKHPKPVATSKLELFIDATCLTRHPFSKQLPFISFSLSFSRFFLALNRMLVLRKNKVCERGERSDIRNQSRLPLAHPSTRQWVVPGVPWPLLSSLLLTRFPCHCPSFHSNFPPFWVLMWAPKSY